MKYGDTIAINILLYYTKDIKLIGGSMFIFVTLINMIIVIFTIKTFLNSRAFKRPESLRFNSRMFQGYVLFTLSILTVITMAALIVVLLNIQLRSELDFITIYNAGAITFILALISGIINYPKNLIIVDDTAYYVKRFRRVTPLFNLSDVTNIDADEKGCYVKGTNEDKPFNIKLNRSLYNEDKLQLKVIIEEKK